MSSEPSKNPTYKLHYFNLKALGEPIRMLFAYGGIEFEDIRVESSEWPALKSSMNRKQFYPILVFLIETNFNIWQLLLLFSNANGSNACFGNR